jgi:hypothetical protein
MSEPPVLLEQHVCPKCGELFTARAPKPGVIYWGEPHCGRCQTSPRQVRMTWKIALTTTTPKPANEPKEGDGK